MYNNYFKLLTHTYIIHSYLKKKVLFDAIIFIPPQQICKQIFPLFQKNDFPRPNQRQRPKRTVQQGFQRDIAPIPIQIGDPGRPIESIDATICSLVASFQISKFVDAATLLNVVGSWNEQMNSTL